MVFSFDELMHRKWAIGFLALGLVLVLVLFLVKSNYDAQAAFLCENIEAAGGDMLACPVHKTDTSWLFVLGFGVSFLILGYGAYGLVRPSRVVSEKKSFAPVDVSQLDGDEKHVYELLRQRNGSVFQSELIRDTSFSKVKISRVLDKLEQENIIERKRRGMANLVVLR